MGHIGPIHSQLGSPNLRVPVYSASEVLEQARRKLSSGRRRRQPYPAMYSSFFGGITLEPALMVIPIDDHMVHRGHGVFDTALIMNGYAPPDWSLQVPVRARCSSGPAIEVRIEGEDLPPFPRATLRSILIQLTAASKCEKGCLRFWLSAGPGDFLLSPAGCPEPGFYAVVVDEDFQQPREGVKVITSTTVNYLPNVLSAMEAEEQGAFAAVWVDDRGFIAERGELLLPRFDKILGGCTAQRLLELAPALVEKGLLQSVLMKDITVEEAKDSAEMMCVGTMLPLLPVIAWDDQPISDGK
ncbi:unnamed protein product [Spirodela intermedia]|uniref:Uncharacterized protein n=1 Tax=Spirodela intermedia TaxID=51605 RepID=A0A7I8J6A6_SPIIN|nr:unnamed protein product [Spirodela intermedia]CAA6665778.1 unnamed protein product [Spirodela intermedia]